ncbi:MAG TPA: PIN domain-containing protein [Candidatus Eisenbacteria bacterium]|nr:PIN domain-containing protein [Candidatus Eisenbacteria bacterium]
MRTYFDTDVLVASVIQLHVHFHAAHAAVLAVRARKIEGCVSAHGLAEFYAVLTRAPFSSPVFPLQAWQALADNFLPAFEVVSLSTEDYKSAIHLCAQHGWAGGRIYDLLHIASANKAGCERIFTFNVRHFQQLAPEYGDHISAPY